MFSMSLISPIHIRISRVVEDPFGVRMAHYDRHPSSQGHHKGHIMDDSINYQERWSNGLKLTLMQFGEIKVTSSSFALTNIILSFYLTRY